MACTVWSVKNFHCVAIRARATPRHFLIWMRTVGQLRRTDNPSVVMLTHILSVNETKNPQHLYCSRSIPATLRGSNYSRLGGLSSGIVLSPIHHRYRSTISRCSGLLWFISSLKGVYDLMANIYRVASCDSFTNIRMDHCTGTNR